jgi:4-amino-4-deoxy-L-arabinose transferase-like glycosyltransferase
MVFHSVTTPESTTLLLLLVAALWLSLARIQEKPSIRLWLIVGVLSALAVLTEPVTVPFVSLSLLYAAWLDRRPIRGRLVNFALAISLMAILVSPWLARNYLVFNRFPVFKSGLGLVFNWGLHFSGKGSWLSDDTMLRLEENGRGLSELQEDEAIRRELRSAFPAHWHEYFTYNVPQNILHFWWDVKRYWNNYSFSYLFGRRLPYVLLLLLALPSLARQIFRLLQEPRSVLRSSPVGVAALVLIATYTLLYSFFGAFHSRYRLPVEMALMIFAVLTIQLLIGTLRRKSANSFGFAR